MEPIALYAFLSQHLRNIHRKSKPVNPRIFVGAAAGVLIAIIVVFTLTGTSIVSDVEGRIFCAVNSGGIATYDRII